MEATWHLTIRSGRVVAAEAADRAGGATRKTGLLWTLGEFCRRAGKSRRQIYRDIRAGRIRPALKLLDTWLVEPAEMARLKPPPPSMASLFPEHDVGTLDHEKDRETILAKVLRYGGEERLRWAFSFYGPRTIREFVRERGETLLDPRSLGFWRLYHDLPRRSKRDERRRKGSRWGGGR